MAGARLELDAAVVRLGNRLHDGQSEAGTLGAARPRAPAEALEDRLLFVACDPGAVVPDPEARLAPGHDRADRDRLAAVGVARGVLGQLHDGLREALAVGDDHALAADVDDPLARGERLHVREEAVGQRADVDRVEIEEVGFLAAGEEQQVLDDPAHPVELVGDERERLAPLLRVVLEQLEMAAHDRQRRLQLVRRVVGEAAL